MNGRMAQPGVLAVLLLAAGAVSAVILAEPAWSQEYTDSPPTLVAVIIPDSQYVFRDDSGHGIVVGMVENRGASHIYGVQIQASFYDDVGHLPLDIAAGTTMLDVMSPGSVSPFVIASSEPDLRITHAATRIMTFGSAPDKEVGLVVAVEGMTSYIIDRAVHSLILNGTVRNGPAPSSDVTLHMALHDAFEPPRTLDVRTIHVGDLGPDEIAAFELDETVPSGTRGVTLFAESDIYGANALQHTLPRPSSIIPAPHTMMLVTVSEVSLRDDAGGRLASSSVGAPVNIRTDLSIQFSDDRTEHETPYTLYVQIKEASESAPVEFVGKYDGRFVDDNVRHVQNIDWIPDAAGIYMAETFVWDRNNIPLAERGPVLLILIEE